MKTRKNEREEQKKDDLGRGRFPPYPMGTVFSVA
jgi:hypothetical protein